jgi:hypothetical protein
MPTAWGALAVAVWFSPPTLVFAAALQWLLRRQIANPWARLLVSMTVAGVVFNVAFFVLLHDLTS